MLEDVFIDENESDEEDRQRFYSVCAENKINAMIARMRELDENFDGPEEFENEAVSMAIQQHGLKNCKNQSPRDSFFDCTSEINENHCNQSVIDSSHFSQPTTSMPSSKILNVKDSINYEEDNNCSKSKQRKHSGISDFQNISFTQSFTCPGYEFNDVDFLNEAVAVAIKKKGLSSTQCNALQ